MVQTVAEWQASQSAGTPSPLPSIQSVAEWQASQPVARTPAPQPSFLGALGSAIKQTGSDFINAFKSDAGTINTALQAPKPTSVPVTPTSYLTDIFGPQGTMGQSGIVGDTFQAWQKTIKQVQNAGQQTTPYARGVGLANAGVDAIGAFFQPLSTVLNEVAASNVPLLSPVADFTNKLFSGVGKIGGDNLGNIVQSAPFLTPQQKTDLVPIAQNIGTLGMQIALGKASADTFGALKDKAQSFVSTLSEDARLKALQNNPDVQAAIQKLTTPSKTLPVTSETPTETPVPIKTGEESAPPQIDIPPNQLPTIQMGPTPKETLPTIQTNAPVSNDLGGGLKLVPEPPVASPVAPETAPTSVSSPETQNVPSTATDVPPERIPEKVRANLTEGGSNPLVNGTNERPYYERQLSGAGMTDAQIQSVMDRTPTNSTGKYNATDVLDAITEHNLDAKAKGATNPDAPQSVPSPYVPLERPVASDGTQVTKAANDINETLVKQGVEKLTPDQQSKFTTGSYKDSVAKTAQMMTDNLPAVKEMAKTGENIPQDVHPQILFNAVEALATKEGDVPLLQDLAKSPLGTQLSESASTMGSHGFNDNPNSAVENIREVQTARDASLAKRGATIKADATARIADSIRKTNTVKTWSDFVASIEC
jgi:hypothetical protein